MTAVVARTSSLGRRDGNSGGSPRLLLGSSISAVCLPRLFPQLLFRPRCALSRNRPLVQLHPCSETFARPADGGLSTNSRAGRANTCPPGSQMTFPSPLCTRSGLGTNCIFLRTDVFLPPCLCSGSSLYLEHLPASWLAPNPTCPLRLTVNITCYLEPFPSLL